jgi:hypothetical protein
MMRFSVARSAAPGLLSCLLPALACAYQPLVTDDTGTQGAGGHQLEAAYDRTVERSHGARATTQEVPLTYTYGVTEALDLFVGLARQRVAPDAPAAAEHGWSNTAVGAKWRFFDDEAAKLSFALRPEIRLPVSRNRETRGLGTARTSYGLGLLMTQETGFGAVHANLAAERVNYADPALNGAERRTRYRLSVAPVWDVTKEWALALDAGLITNPERGERARMGYIEAGTIYALRKNLEIALGVIRDVMDGGASTTRVTVGITWWSR